MRLDPSWTWLHPDPPERSYDHARLLDNRVVGGWFCLDRDTGQEIWHSREGLPNSIYRIHDGKIIGTETLSHGPMTGDWGIYGIDLETGRVLWTHHKEGELEVSPKRLQLVEGEEGWDRDSPDEISDEGLVTLGRRLLDLESGRLIRKLDPKPNEPILMPRSPRLDLFFQGVLDQPGLGRLYLGTGEVYQDVKEQAAEADVPGYYRVPAHMGRGESFGFTFESEAGEILWEFDLPVDRYWCDGNYYAYREFGRFVLMIYAEPEVDPQTWDDQFWNGQDPVAPFYLSALDLETGQLAATLPLGDRPVAHAEIEAIDDRSLLVSALLPPDRLFLHIPLDDSSASSS